MVLIRYPPGVALIVTVTLERVCTPHFTTTGRDGRTKEEEDFAETGLMTGDTIHGINGVNFTFIEDSSSIEAARRR